MSTTNLVRFILMMFMLCVVSQVVDGEQEMRCLPKEREALLQFKAAIVDHYGMLSSWTTPDCCLWQGIRCSNLTAHILSLHLPGEYPNFIQTGYISGEIHQSLTELPQLQYVNLSSNYFGYKKIPEFFGSFRYLKYLDLSSCGFGGEIPRQLGSLSNLKYLNLASNSLNGSIPGQFGNLSKLQHLDLWHNFLEANIPSFLGNLSQLQHLRLSCYYFEGNIPSQLGNLTKLEQLYLGGYLGGGIKIEDGGQWLSNLLSLTHFSLVSVSNLDRSYSWLKVITKLPELRELSLVGCSLSDHFILLSKPSKLNFSTSLSVLDLSQNTFTSPMVLQWVSNITSNLVELDLSANHLEGFTSSDFGMVKNSLRRLDLSSNNFKAKDLKSFTNICTLHSLYLSSNKFTEDLPSILSNLSSGCVRHSLQELDLSLNHIVGTLSDISVFSSLKTLFLQINRLSGRIPEGVKLPSTLEDLSISENFFKGGIPKSFGNACALHSFDMSANNLNVELPTIISHLSGCARYSLQELYLHMNKITDCWRQLNKLVYLDLSHNNFSGKIPMSMGSLLDLQALFLRNNNLVEGIPFSLRNCTELVMLDMSENKLSGSIPDWIGTKEELQILSLGKNQFFGSLPLEVCCLRSIQVLDLSINNLSGKIPKCIKDLTSMTQTPSSIDYGYHSYFFKIGVFDTSMTYDLSALLTWKGLEQMFMNKGLSLLKLIDLSSNHFSGEIPVEIEKLSGLISLNLSRNNLIGKIPSNIGKLASLNSLDLSRNWLVGSIPPSLAQLYGLGVLDLSHNHLSGKIPTGTQLQSFNKSSYENNLDLCGPPLERLCIDGKLTQGPNPFSEKVFKMFINEDRNFFLVLDAD
ncbi:LRR receptor-like serine/threonine-protein kinase FLS2 [Vigna unguiculata]|uniref:LRR receptor-like serine/threonine-protein kinase FLS2 n=1 Tax=Vigna unguiculata TaxID=3917 RepID=A0A4D6M2E4_VIGUN|nr:LRR receptor-like serine/threonine-protein kinase FLS2 [Vigna unguiculata]